MFLFVSFVAAATVVSLVARWLYNDIYKAFHYHSTYDEDEIDEDSEYPFTLVQGDVYRSPPAHVVAMVAFGTALTLQQVATFLALWMLWAGPLGLGDWADASLLTLPIFITLFIDRMSYFSDQRQRFGLQNRTIISQSAGIILALAVTHLGVSWFAPHRALSSSSVSMFMLLLKTIACALTFFWRVRQSVLNADVDYCVPRVYTIPRCIPETHFRPGRMPSIAQGVFSGLFFNLALVPWLVYLRDEIQTAPRHTVWAQDFFFTGLLFFAAGTVFGALEVWATLNEENYRWWQKAWAGPLWSCGVPVFLVLFFYQSLAAEGFAQRAVEAGRIAVPLGLLAALGGQITCTLLVRRLYGRIGGFD